jgi:type IV secretory pathway VirJ component
MNKIAFLVFACVLSATINLWAEEESISFGPSGSITLYYNSPSPKNVAIFVSGDGGWNLGVVDMARELTSLDTLVVGVDITHYLKEIEKSDARCLYPAGDFEELSKFVQKRLAFPRYITPVLVGYSSGATLVYATLVQAPFNTFRGAISLGFCPDLLLARPLCKGSGLEWGPGPKGKGYSFLPAKTLEVPWIAFQGTIDQVCDANETEAYVKQVPNGKLVLLPKVGHGFSVPKNWLPEFRQAFTTLVAKEDSNDRKYNVNELRDLPLVEVPATGQNKDTMAVFVSGDGGWSITDRGLSRVLSQHGIPVVGLNSLHYFWTRRTPETAAKDMDRILTYYSTAWRKKEVIAIGYSMGADVLPFMLNRLPSQTLSKVQSVVLIGPGHKIDFQFHLKNWLGRPQPEEALAVIPEVEKLNVKNTVCIYGMEDSDTICNSLPSGKVKIIELKGGHRVGRNYEGIADEILQKAE